MLFLQEAFHHKVIGLLIKFSSVCVLMRVCKQHWKTLPEKKDKECMRFSKERESVYLCRCHTDRQTSPTCNTPLGWWEGLWYRASSAEQTGLVRQLENWAWWRTHAASRRTTWWCSPTSCRRSQRWHILLWKIVSKLKKEEEKNSNSHKYLQHRSK